MSAGISEPVKKFSVGQVGRAIQKMLRERADELWVVGELIEFERNAGKFHKFATLVEKNEKGEVTASLRIIIWNSTFPKIQRAIKEGPQPFELQDNIEVCFKVRLEFYVPGGALNAVVTEVDPTHTLSELEKKRVEILKILQKEGLLENNKLLPLPPVITRIGLITGQKSAGEADFIGELQRSGYAFEVFTCHATVQGKQTEPTVISALQALSKLSLDVICIIRGGGSRVDLAWFDNEAIARGILGLNIPVFSGIGHDIDVCVVDDIANRHFITPTAAAQAIIATVDNFLNGCREAFHSIRGIWEGRIQDEFRSLNENLDGLMKGSGKIVGLSRQHFFNFALRFKGQWVERTHEQRLHFAEAHQTLRQLPQKIAYRKKALLENVQGLRVGPWKIMERRTQPFTLAAEKLKSRWRLQYQKQLAQVDGLQKLVNNSHPDRQLKRGYSITLNSQGAPLGRTPLRTGDEITTLGYKRRLKSKITEVTNHE